MSAVLLTGGAGFIGSHTTERLLELGYEVVLVDNMNDYYDVTLKHKNIIRLKAHKNANRLTVYEADICDKQLIKKIFDLHKIQLVCHLAARAGVRASIDDPFEYLRSNVEGTIVLLEQARQSKVTNFVYASSSSVYGNDLEIPFGELDTTDRPVSPYAASKKACEIYAYAYHQLYSLNCAGLRFFTVYGPRGRPDMAVFKFVDKIYRGEEIHMYGDGTTERDYTYVDDVVDGTIRALENPRPFEIYNIGNGKPVRLSEMISIIQRFLGIKANITMLPKQPGDVDMTHADISHAEEVLGYEPSTTLAEGLKRTVEWYLEEYVKPSEIPESESSAESDCTSMSRSSSSRYASD